LKDECTNTPFADEFGEHPPWDFAEWRGQVRSRLQTRPDWQVIGEACDGLEAVQRTKELHPELVLLDIGMTIMNGIEAAKGFDKLLPLQEVFFCAGK